MDPSSAAQSQPHLSRDEKRHLFEEQKQQRLERFSAGTPFSSSGRMGEDVEQIQDKVYELHLQGSPTSNGVGACVTHLPGTKRRVHMEDEDDQQASATKRSRVATGECSSFLPVGIPFSTAASCSSRRLIAPHPQAPPPLPLAPPPASSSPSSSSSSTKDWQHKALWLEHRAQAEGIHPNTNPREREVEDEGGGMMMMAMEEEGLGTGGGGESSSWVPLPPRRQQVKGRSRASSIERMTS